MAATKDAVKNLTKPSDPEQVNAYMQQLNHPMKEAAAALRTIILNAHKEIGEEIYWNAPSFFYTGKMKPFAPKEYKRVIAVFNFYKKDCLRVIFLTGAKLNDASGLLTGGYGDGRRIALFYSLEQVQANEKNLQKLIRKWLTLLDK